MGRYGCFGRNFFDNCFGLSYYFGLRHNITHSFLVISVRGNGAEPTIAANLASGVTGFMNAAFAFLGDDDFAIGLRLSSLGHIINAKLEKKLIFSFFQRLFYPFSIIIVGRLNNLKPNQSEIFRGFF